MHSYNIISKWPKGMQEYKNYTIEYQLDGNPRIHKLSMCCLYFNKQDKLGKRMVFIEGNYEGVNTAEERHKFGEELKEFQKGANYRKKHPIVLDERQKLQEQIVKLQAEVDKIDQKENDILVNEYIKNNTFDEELLAFEKNLDKMFSDHRYEIRDYNFKSTFGRAVIYDKLRKIPVKVVFFGLKEYRDLTYNEMLEVIKEKQRGIRD